MNNGLSKKENYFTFAYKSDEGTYAIHDVIV